MLISNITIMKNLISSFLLLLLFSCGQTPKDSDNNSNNSIEQYDTFDKENHLQPDFAKVSFDTLHEWDLGWALLEPINKASDKDEEEIKLSKSLSPGQKALYFYWYLNDEVTNGGFIQFYWNDYRKYIPPIKNGLKLIGDTAMLELVEQADKEYLANKDKFDSQREKNDWSPLYDNLKRFDTYDSIFYKIQNRPMELIEIYVRKHPEEFVKLK
jgi:Domain of unknown function (DUF4375)